MHNTIQDLQHIMNTQKQPTIIHLTKTKHNHIILIWREALKDYKLVSTYPTLDPTTNRKSSGIILAARQDTYKGSNRNPHTTTYRRLYIRGHTHPIWWLPHHSNIGLYATAPHKSKRYNLYRNPYTWIHTEIISKFPTVTTLMGGDLQATPSKGDKRSNHAPLNQFYKESRLKHITPKGIHTYVLAKTSIDHWLRRHPNTTWEVSPLCPEGSSTGQTWPV